MSRHRRDNEPRQYLQQGMPRDEGDNIAGLQRLMHDLEDLLESRTRACRAYMHRRRADESGGQQDPQ